MDGLQTLYLGCCLYENKENEWLGEVVLCDRNEGKLLVPGSFLFPIVCRSRDYLSWRHKSLREVVEFGPCRFCS